MSVLTWATGLHAIVYAVSVYMLLAPRGGRQRQANAGVLVGVSTAMVAIAFGVSLATLRLFPRLMTGLASYRPT